jgi:hypothetical protein
MPSCQKAIKARKVTHKNSGKDLKMNEKKVLK